MLVKDAIHFVTSDRDANFTDSLITSASEYEDLQIVPGTTTTQSQTHGRCWIKSVRLHAATNHAFTVVFLSRAGGINRIAATPYNNAIVDFFKWAATDAIATASEWVYGKTGLNIPYQDEELRGQIHIGIINDSAATKGALGATLSAGVGAQYMTLKIGVIQAT